MNNYYSPFDTDESGPTVFTQLEEGYYILELVGTQKRNTKSGQPVLIAELAPRARVIQSNGQQKLEVPNNDKPVESAFWLFSVPRDAASQRVTGIGYAKNNFAGNSFSALMECVSGYSREEMKQRYSPDSLAKQGIELVVPVLTPNGTKDNPLIENVNEITEQWRQFLHEFVVVENTDPEVKNHVLIKCFVTLKVSDKLDANGNPYINPEIGFVKGTYDPLFIPLSTREYELYQEMVDAPDSEDVASEDDFQLPGGGTRF